MIPRNIAKGVLEAVADTPVIFIRGARQVGKTTLVRSLAEGELAADCLTLDNAIVLAAAVADPTGFTQGRRDSGPLVIDEVQKAPGLFPAIKEAVDQDRRPGRFILTGSTNILTSLKLADSLAGRMEVFDLWPLSMGELAGRQEGFIDRLFSRSVSISAFQYVPEPARKAYERVLAGGYPEVLGRSTGRRRTAWYRSYVTTLVERDVRNLVNIQDLTAMPRLLRALAARCASLLDHAGVSRDLGIPQTTIKRYTATLAATFLVYELSAWAPNIGKRLVKAPKVMFSDTGLAAHLLGLDLARLMEDGTYAGRLLENFVASELCKQAAWAKVRVQPYHFRTTSGREVDIVLEDPAGRVVGVEVKAGASPGAGDFAGLKALKDILGDKFVRGVVLHLGNVAVPFGPDLFALPVSALAF